MCVKGGHSCPPLLTSILEVGVEPSGSKAIENGITTYGGARELASCSESTRMDESAPHCYRGYVFIAEDTRLFNERTTQAGERARLHHTGCVTRGYFMLMVSNWAPATT